MPYITEIYAKEILDSKGLPTLECEVFTESGAYGRASVSSMYDQIFDNKEVRDKDNKRYLGLGVLKAVENINNIVEKALVGEDVRDQAKIDNKLLKIDNTLNKSKLGVNTILSVSLAVARAASDYTGLSLHTYLGGPMSRTMPSPVITIATYKGFQVMAEVIKEIPVIEKFSIINDIKNKFLSNTQTLNNDVSFNECFTSLDSVLDEIKKIIESLGLKITKDINLILNVSSDYLYDTKSKKYSINDDKKSSLEMIEYYESLLKKYNISMFIDPLSHQDSDNYKKLTKRLGQRTKIAGYNLYSSSRRKIEKGLANFYSNSIILNISEIGTLTETYDLVEYIKNRGINVSLAISNSESEDSFIADLGVALNIDKLILSSIDSNGSTPKYNELIRIEDSLASKH